MDFGIRYAELLFADRRLRLAIYARPYHRFKVVEERILSYEANDADNPEQVPFPVGHIWEPFWMIDARMRDGVYGLFADALRDAELLLGKMES